jgi:hypothetical protein
MKLQNQFPYDSAILGLDNLYFTIPNGSFFINAKCIITNDHIITTGHTYLLVSSSQYTGIELLAVTLVDVYYYEGIVHILLQDSLTEERFTVYHCIECPESPCHWMLVDLNYLSNTIDKHIINAYYEKNIKKNRTK